MKIKNILLTVSYILYATVSFAAGINQFSSFEIEGMQVISQKEPIVLIAPFDSCYSSFPGLLSNSGSGNIENQACWVASAWSQCSNGCGDGTKSRSVECLDGTSKLASNDCVPAMKFSSAQSCSDFSNCQYIWEAEEWGNCTAACGESVMNRSVWCKNTTDNSVAEDILCRAGSKPGSQQPCEDMSLCSSMYEWKSSSWSTCSAGCNLNGEMNRAVSCVEKSTQAEVDEKYCGFEEKPISNNTCVGSCASCKEIKASDATLPSGTYGIEVDGLSTSVYCEMTANGGGWTRLASSMYVAAKSYKTITPIHPYTDVLAAWTGGKTLCHACSPATACCGYNYGSVYIGTSKIYDISTSGNKYYTSATVRTTNLRVGDVEYLSGGEYGDNRNGFYFDLYIR